MVARLMGGFLGESWRAWLAVCIGVLAISAQTASSFALSVLMKPMVAEFAWNRADFASVMTTRMLTMTLAMTLAGHLTDQIGPRLVLAMGALVIGIGTMLIATVHQPGYLFLLMACIGPGQAAIGSVAASALVLRQFRQRRGIAVGLLNGGDNLLTSSVPVLAALLLERIGWRGTLLSLGSLYLLLAVFFVVSIPWITSRAATGTTPVPKRQLGWRDLPWRDSRLWVLIVAYAAIYAFITSVQLHLHAFQTDSGLTAEQASRVLSIQILIGAVGSPLFGWMAERWSSPSALLVVVGGLFVTSIVLWTGHGVDTFTTWAVAYGIVNSGVVAILALVLSDMFGREQIGRLMGLAMMFCMGSTMLANLYAAAMFDAFHTYIPVWQGYSALMLLTLAPVLWLWTQRHRVAV